MTQIYLSGNHRKGETMSKRIISPADELLTSLNAPLEEEPVTPKKSTAKKKPSGSRTDAPAKKEIRDVHVNLVLKPSLVEALKDEAWKQRRSLNNLVEEILTAYTKKIK